jgi:cation transport ATPase
LTEAGFRRGMLAWPAAWLALGLVGLALGQGWSADAFVVATIPVLFLLLADILRGLARGEFGLDLLAGISMTGALLFQEYLAGAVVALMFAGGTALEEFARNRARREMTALLARQPRVATRHGANGLEQVPVEALRDGLAFGRGFARLAEAA